MYEDEIIVQLNDASFAYDVHSLYQAFYPHTRICVRTEGDGEADFSYNGSAHAGGWKIAVNEDAICLKQFHDGRPADAAENRENAAAFLSGDERSVLIAGLLRADVKNCLKRLIYDALCAHTGRTLPWGTLTGIRPTKLALARMLSGETEEETAAFMRETYRVSEEKIALCMQVAAREAGILRAIAEMDPAGHAGDGSVYRAAAGRASAVFWPADREHVLPQAHNLLTDGYCLYIGIPFCPSICLYCSFSSYAIGAYQGLVEDYLRALYREIDAVAGMFADRPLAAVYIGGGTPTSLSAAQLDRLIGKVERTFRMAGVLEFTVEAGRPDSLDRDKLAVIASHFGGGIRISINPQTFQQRTLDLIGRRHTTEDICRCYEDARAAGLSHINMDLIAGLPGETVADVADTLRQVKRLSPDNLTVHALAIKRSSRLHEILTERANRLDRIADGECANRSGRVAGEAHMNRSDRIADEAYMNRTDSAAEGGQADRSPEYTFTEDGYRDYFTAHGDEIMAMAHQAAADMGMQPYYLYRQKNIAGNLENVGFAPNGKEGLYNIIIMEEQQDIVALGAGAACKRIARDENGLPLPKAKIRRCENVKNVEEYIARIDEMIERKRQLYFESIFEKF